MKIFFCVEILHNIVIITVVVAAYTTCGFIPRNIWTGLYQCTFINRGNLITENKNGRLSNLLTRAEFYLEKNLMLILIDINSKQNNFAFDRESEKQTHSVSLGTLVSLQSLGVSGAFRN